MPQYGYVAFIDSMKLAAGRGIVPTSFSFDPVISDARNVLTGAPFDEDALGFLTDLEVAFRAIRAG